MSQSICLVMGSSAIVSRALSTSALGFFTGLGVDLSVRAGCTTTDRVVHCTGVVFSHNLSLLKLSVSGIMLSMRGGQTRG
jgi:hypothetical protein